MKLNEYTDETKKVIHILVTPLCDRNCTYCCNKQYSLNDIPCVTDAELKEAETICLTGGEPFKYAAPNRIARYYKQKYPNIKQVFVYSNAYEFSIYSEDVNWIDGLNISIKDEWDLQAFEVFYDDTDVLNLKSNRLYVFGNLTPRKTGNFELHHREWQKEFVPARDSIFRRM